MNMPALTFEVRAPDYRYERLVIGVSLLVIFISNDIVHYLCEFEKIGGAKSGNSKR